MLNNSEISNIPKRLKDVVAGGKEQFFSSLLLAYGFPKSSIKRAEDYMKQSESRICSIRQRILYFECPESENLETAYLDVMEDVKAKERFLFVTDFKRIMARDMLSGKGIDILFKDLPDNYEFFLPWCGRETVDTDFENPADVKAAREMGYLYEAIRTANSANGEMSPRVFNIFLSRLLFCFYADDTKIFKHNQFRDGIMLNTAEDGSDVSQYIAGLFDVLDRKPGERDGVHEAYKTFPYVNGGLFSEHLPVPRIDRVCRRKILECCAVDWTDINPDIFGSMFQTVISEEQRRNLGQHYTSVVNIMKVLRPLFLDELHEELDKILSDSVGKVRDRKLTAFRERLSNIVVFDPACGSGNFLIIAYKELCRLEMEALSGYSEPEFPFLKIKLENFYGIEIDDFPCDVARLALWLAQHQINLECYAKFGNANPTLPLTASGNIRCDNALSMNWNSFCQPREQEVYVCGNPPYAGHISKTEEQRRDIQHVFENRITTTDLDYISCWFIKGSDYIRGNNLAKIGFVTTNSVIQGKHVKALWPAVLKNDEEFFFGYESFKWKNSARDVAGVTVTIIGIRNTCDAPKYLYNESSKLKATSINHYLKDESSKVVVASTTKIPLGLPKCRFGVMFLDHGNLMFQTREKNIILDSYPNASKFIRRIYGSDEFIYSKERWCLWISTEELNEAEKIPPIKEKLEANKLFRENSKQTGDAYKARNTYWRPREFPNIEKAAILLPEVSSERYAYIPMGYLPAGTVISNRAFSIHDAPEWLFAILTSQMHMVWVRAVAGRFETRINYSNTICYNTFPFPSLTDTQKNTLKESAERILNIREDHYEMTMAQLYDPDKMPEDLKAAHESNDLLVDSLFRKSGFDSDEDRLSELFRRYEANIQGGK